MYEDSLTGGNLMVLSGRANQPLSERVAGLLGCELGEATIKNFADGEIFVRIDDNVRGRDLYIIQSTCPPSDNILELLLLLDAARRASAARITAVPSPRRRYAGSTSTAVTPTQPASTAARAIAAAVPATRSTTNPGSRAPASTVRATGGSVVPPR